MNQLLCLIMGDKRENNPSSQVRKYIYQIFNIPSRRNVKIELGVSLINLTDDAGAIHEPVMVPGLILLAWNSIE